MTTPDTSLFRMIAEAEAKCDRDVAAYREAAERDEIVPSLREQRRDALRARAAYRAQRGRYYAFVRGID